MDHEAPSSGSEPIDREGDTIRAEHDWTSTPPSVAVIEMVAVVTDQEPTAMGALYPSIDPDALDALFRRGPDEERGLRLSFSYEGLRVTVADDGEIVVEPRRDYE